MVTASREYPDELRERATRMALEACWDPVRSGGAISRIAGELGVHSEVLTSLCPSVQGRGRS